MVLIVDDKSKDEVLDGLMASIHKTQIEYCNNLEGPRKQELRERLDQLTFSYNMMLDKRITRAQSNRQKSLCQPGSQSESEKLALLQLIEST
jgi:hypothetical protein